MSSFSEFHSTTTDYRSNNGHVRGDRSGQQQQQQHRTGKRQLRRSFERQLSDKHLKRRTQLLQQQNNKGKHGTGNRRFLYEDPLATVVSGSSSSASLPQLDHQHHPSQSSYDWHRRRRCPDPRGFVFNRHKTRSIFLVFLLMVLFLLILLLVLPTLLSPSTTAFSPKTIQSMPIPGIVQGGGNGAALDNGSGNVNSGNGNEKGRSYQDLADSIRRLRIRREAMEEGKAVAAENDQLDANVDVDNDVDVDYDSDRRIPIGRRRGRLDDDQEEENRLKRLEEKIQMDQKEKVRQELLLSRDNHNIHDRDARETNGQRRIPNGTAGRRSDPQETNGNHDIPDTVDDPSVLKNKVMSENIAALKLFNEKNQKSH